MATIIWTHEDITLERTHSGMFNAYTWVTDLGGTDRLTRVTCDTMAGAVEVVQTWMILLEYTENHMQEILMTIPGLGESWAAEVDNDGAYIVDLGDLEPDYYGEA